MPGNSIPPFPDPQPIWQVTVEIHRDKDRIEARLIDVAHDEGMKING